MINDIKVIKIFNSRREKTIGVILKTNHGVYKGFAPSGKSKSKYEAKVKDINFAIKSFRKFKKLFKNKDESEVDNLIEEIGINRIGANLSIALSIAATRAKSRNKVYELVEKNKSFPYPVGNVIGGGMHRGNTTIQEFLSIPTKSKTIQEAVLYNKIFYNEVGKELKSKKVLIGKNDEGAWISKYDDFKTLDFLSNMANQFDVRLGIDIAASHFYEKNNYNYKFIELTLTSEKQLDFVYNLIKTYKLLYVEDPFYENDFKSFSQLTKISDCYIVGDDLYATNYNRLKKGIKLKSGNAIVIKPDQVGTVHQTLKTVELANKNNFTTVVSHRSGETTDSFIADLSLTTKSKFIKCGIFGKERESKLKRLLELSKLIGSNRMVKL